MCASSGAVVESRMQAPVLHGSAVARERAQTESGLMSATAVAMTSSSNIETSRDPLAKSRVQ
jgi:hypothetical protein